MGVYNQVRWFAIKPSVKSAQCGGKKVTVGTTSTEIVAANDDRTCLYLENLGSETCYIYLGDEATTDHLPLYPGDVLVDDTYTGKITGICASGSTTIYVIEE